MAHREDLIGRMRAAMLMREIEHARRSLSLGPAGLFIRAAVAVVFMCLVLNAYATLGVVGPVVVSVLSLVVFFVPALFRLARRSHFGCRMRAFGLRIAGSGGVGQVGKRGELTGGDKSSKTGRSGR